MYPLLGQLPLTLDVTYWWKLRAETLSSGDSRFSFKVWSAQETEPTNWQLIGTERSPWVNGNGSLIFVAHHVYATFGDITVIDLVDDNQPPAISNVTATSQSNDVLIRWTTDEPASSKVQHQ